MAGETLGLRAEAFLKPAPFAMDVSSPGDAMKFIDKGFSDAARFRRIAIGATQDAVRGAAGAPALTFVAGRQTLWIYTYVDSRSLVASYDVVFGPDGRVERTSHTRVEF